MITPHDISSANIPFRAGEREKPSEEGSASVAECGRRGSGGIAHGAEIGSP